MRYDSQGRLLVSSDGGAAPGGATGGLTDAELRATAVAVSGPVTDAQLRAAAVAISAAALPLPTGAATAARQDLAQAKLDSIDSKTPALQSGAAPVTAVPRQCLGRQTLALSAGVVTTLTVPAGAVAAAIQADGNTIRCTLDGATAPSATAGTRVDDGVIYYVDTALANVKLLAPVACSAQVAYFDRA